DLNGEEESAADQLTPTQDGSEEMTEERIRELEEQMQLLEKSDENNDPEQFVYSRKFLYFIRKVTLAFKTVNCPKTEDELEELGLSRRGMPTVQAFSAGGKAKRFDGASSDQFKTAWQQPGGGLNQFGTGSDARFTTTRPPYSGRHSDNKLKPKKVIASWGPIARQSLDQRPLKSEQISSSQAAELSKRSSNAWKPKREERFDMNAPTKAEDEIKYEKLCKEVRGLLNKVTPSTYKDLSEDFIQYKIQEDPKLLEMIIDLIFDKAVEEPHFCPLYSDLCKRQVEEERRTMTDKQTQEKSFRSELIQKCQKTFLVSNQFDEKVSELKKKSDELDEADEKGRARLEEEIESRRSKEKRRLLGIIRWGGGGGGEIIVWCTCELIKRYENTKDEVYIEYAVELLETVGKLYEKREIEMLRTSASVAPDQKPWRAEVVGKDMQDQKESFSLPKIFQHFGALKKEMSNRIRFAIMDLEELRKNNWMPRGGEKGPKTIEEVREEVEKEQQENELERIEHDNKQKEREKIQLMSRKKPHPGYGGRNSMDRPASLHAASKVESRISATSRLKDVDNASGLGGSRMKFDHNRERMPKKEDNAAPTSTGGAAGGGGGTSSSGTAWRSKRGTDTSKDSSNQGGGD
uniref:MIF4G domain-containing protein n=1 Tax=Globodera pallida TaxID=36090 RepID=A0A183C888_GLOPA